MASAQSKRTKLVTELPVIVTFMTISPTSSLSPVEVVSLIRSGFADLQNKGVINEVFFKHVGSKRHDWNFPHCNSGDLGRL